MAKQSKGDRDRNMIPQELANEIMRGNVIDNETGQPITYVEALLDMEYARNPSTLIKIPMTEKEHGDLAYLDTLSDNMPRGKKSQPIAQEDDGWKLGLWLFLIMIGVIVMLIGKYAGLWL